MDVGVADTVVVLVKVEEIVVVSGVGSACRCC